MDSTRVSLEAESRSASKSRNKVWKAVTRYKFLYLLLVPAVVANIIFAYLPMVGITVAFQEYNLWKGIFGSPFVGFKHFTEIFTVPMFKDTVLRTLWFSSVSIVVGFPFPILLALLINEIRSTLFKRVAQTITYLPYFLSWIAVVGLVYTITSNDGVINQVLGYLFPMRESTNFMMNKNLFLPIMVMTDIWKGVGWGSIIYLAAITGIDKEMYEAVYIDGCKRLKQIWYITLPSILPTIMVVLIFSVGGLLNSNFQLVYGLQNVYNIDSTEVISTLLYRMGILQGKYSITAAFGISQGLVTFVLMFAANQLSKKLSQVSIF